jgi:hypothetical protein
MDTELKLALDLVTVLIVHGGQYPSKADIEAAAQRIVASAMVPGIALRENALINAVSLRYPPCPEQIGQRLAWR